MKLLNCLLLGALAAFASCTDSSTDSEVADAPVPIRLMPSVEIQPESTVRAAGTTAATSSFLGSQFEIHITPTAPATDLAKYAKYTYQLTASSSNGTWKLDGTYGLSAPFTPLSGETPLWAGRTVETIVEASTGWMKDSDFKPDAPLDNPFLDQTTLEKQIALDFLHYRDTFPPQKKLGIDMKGTFNFAFHHHLSQLNVTLQFGTDYDNVAVDQWANGIQAAGIFNTINSYVLHWDSSWGEMVKPGSESSAQKFPNTTTGADILAGVEYINPYREAPTKNASGHYEVKIEAIVVPQTLKAGTELIILRLKKLNTAKTGFETTGDTWFIYQMKQDETLEGGYSYNLTLKTDATGTTTRSATILQKGDWQ